MKNAQSIAFVFLLCLLPKESVAQDLGSSIISGLAKQGINKAKEFGREAPEQINDFVNGEPRKFDSEQACLSELQLSVNGGVVFSSTMPFSNVWIFETDEGPTARFRLLANGEKVHAEVHCRNDELIAKQLPWTADLPVTEPYNNGVLSAGLGAWLILNERSVKSGEPVGTTSSRMPDPKDLLAPSVSKEQTTDNQVASALARALGQANKAKVPPLTGGEKDSVRSTVQQCWNVGSLSAEALRTTVVVGAELNSDGTLAGDVKLISSDGGGRAATGQAYEAARRAILRCGAGGFKLPVEKYEHWREIKLSFNPENMRIK